MNCRKIVEGFPKKIEVEAETRIELVNAAFAEPCLTTWLLRR